MGLSPETRFGFTYGSASGVFVCTFGKTLRMQECAIVFGIVQLSGKLGEKWKYWKVSVKELEAGGSRGVCFPFVSRVC